VSQPPSTETETVLPQPATGSIDDKPRPLLSRYTPADTFFRRAAIGVGLTTLLILVFIGVNLVIKSTTAFRSQGWGFFTHLQWHASGNPPVFGIAAIVYWTVIIAAIALTIAVPVSIACALFLTELAPRSLRAPLRSLVDLLAAIPSLIYGLWGAAVLQPLMVPLSRFLADKMGWFPLFHGSAPPYTSSALIAGVVVSLMVIPICASVIREVFSQTPQGEKEAALALGATRWSMIRTVVLTFGKGGIIGGSMLGLGRALGETIAVALIIDPTFIISPNILHTGANSVAAFIALRFGEADSLQLSGLMAAGLALFALTLVVNTLAAFVVSRSRSGAGVEL
jgi:phosphate transport system permease protein